MTNLIIRLFIWPLLLSTLVFSSCTHEGDDDQFNMSAPANSILNPSSSYIVVLGDIQEYTSSNRLLAYLNTTCKWIKTQQDYYNVIACVLQDGDLTETNRDTQWHRADSAFSYLGDNILVIPSTGNHDYKWGGPYSASQITDRNSTHLNEMTNLKPLRRSPMQQFEQGKLDNIIVPVKVGKNTINIIALEFGPRKEAVVWADSIVRANPNEKYILMTHEWMSASGLRIAENSYAERQFITLSHSTPEEIWEKMVYPNDNILCVLCGHNGFCKYLFSENAAGREVCQVLFNLQYQKNGGNGMIQLWEFPEDENVINIFVYNAKTETIHSDIATQIIVQL